MSDKTRMRLDAALVERGLAPSRSRARDAILRGAVSVEGAPETKPGRMVAADTALAVEDPAAGYVSRAALKLVAAFDAFGFDPKRLTALDLGASTGGFTQVLLRRGADHVIAVDVGHAQLHPTLAADPRVTLIEGLNARDLRGEHLGGRKIDAIVADLSFIPLKLALPPALALAEPGAWGVFLVKPQFEVGREAIGKGGIVRDAKVAEKAAEHFGSWLEGQHLDDATASHFREGVMASSLAPSWHVVGRIPSPIVGGSGNREYLVGAQRA